MPYLIGIEFVLQAETSATSSKTVAEAQIGAAFSGRADQEVERCRKKQRIDKHNRGPDIPRNSSPDQDKYAPLEP